jgi:hypothetical protein
MLEPDNFPGITALRRMLEVLRDRRPDDTQRTCLIRRWLMDKSTVATINANGALGSVCIPLPKG